MSSACRMGTPEASMDVKLLQNRANATLVVSLPNTGAFNVNGSHQVRMMSLLRLRFQNMTNATAHTMITGMPTGAVLPISTMICVTHGSSAPIDAYMLSNMGTMVSSITPTSSTAMPSTTTG